MAIRDALAALFGRQDTSRAVEWLGPSLQQMVLGLTAEELYRTQPHLRIVLDFVARNVAHLGLPAFERVDDNDRRRLKDDPLAQLFARPNPSMTRYELIESLVLDLGLYDIAYWLVLEVPDSPSGWRIQPIPPSWVVGHSGGTAFAPGKYKVRMPTNTTEEISAEDMLVFHGWNPGRPKQGTSPVETLKQILAEQIQAWSYREQVWQRGGRASAIITRPAGANWSDSARERFVTDWKARWTGANGAKAGGTPILEDGMTINNLGFSAREDEWAEVAKVALSTVAAVYHVNPVMVGILDNANFSNTKEFRKMLYSETLGPLLAMIEDRLNTFLVPRVTKAQGAYLEFNIAEKLQGDFEEQATILSTSTGAPWMLRSEARARMNMPYIEGMDEPVVPLNVLIGGQASPRDTGSQNQNAAPVRVKSQHEPGRIRAKAHPSETYEAKADEVVRAFFKRQRKSVLDELGAKDADWWEEERWNRELADDLHALALTVTASVGTATAEQMGFDPDEYDVDRTQAFLKEVAASRAGAINSTTRDQIAAILDGEGPEDADGPAHVFDVAEESRSSGIAATITTTLVAFATVEAARQTAPAATKTWLVTSGRPRAEHAQMDGETVGIDDLFSNGAKWPGDPVLGADGVAGCTCDVEIIYG
ncbi:phage portal protein [Leucobacter chromiiresistens]|uniref:Phage portal protein, HK97 family n=1 Tax=Leucobacter chromiiresistens TaxID=1079994 RepID=A0A1H0XQE9_9MICO|nr:phage portal protein [Leucobacter chromiiresistens]SDQ05154.1 phage portal protein, HK97 family [Leucobacter chromiiresistens]